MSLIKCPECGKEISNKSVQCIYCGCPLKEGDSREKTFNKTNFTNTLTKVLNNLLIKIKNSFETFWGKPHGKIVVIVCLCVFVFLSFVTWVEATKGEKLDWNEEIYLSDELPEPPNKRATIHSNSDGYLSVEFYKVTKKEFLDYRKKCIEKGYNISPENSDSSYYSYNAKGYDLSLSWDSSDEEMDIWLDIPEEPETLQWDTYELGKYLPKTKSSKGLVLDNTKAHLKLQIANTEIEDFNNYVNQCVKQGFSLEQIKDETKFSARNEEGYNVIIEHLGYNAMVVEINEPTSETSINVHCIENLILNEYDLDIYIDEEFIGSLEHGGEETYDVNLSEGEHTLSVESQDDSSIDGSVEFSVVGNNKFSFEIYCETDQIKVEQMEQIAPPITNDNLEGKSYEEVIEAFENAGFKEVEAKGLANLTAADMNKNGTVSLIKIGSSESFTTDNKFFTDEPVQIQYNSPQIIEIGYDDEDLEDVNYESTIEKLEKQGFVSISTETTTTSYESEAQMVKEVTIDGYSSFSADEEQPIDVEIVVDYYVYEPETESESNGVDETDEGNESEQKQKARRTFEDYGELCYPYGFKCHWFLGLIHEEQLSDGSWYFKVEVTVENAYGNKVDAIAEGIVNGYSVTGFYVG